MKSTTEKFTIVGDLQLSVQNALGGINQLQDKLSKLKLPQQNQQELTGAYKKLQSEAQNYINIVSKGFKTKADKKELERSFGNIKKYINEWNTAFDNIDTKALRQAFDELNGGEIKQLTNSINQLDTQLKDLGKESSNSIKSTFSTIRENIRQNLQDSLSKDEYESKLTELNKIFSSTANTLAKNFGEGRFDLVEGNLEKLTERIKKLFEGTNIDDSKIQEVLTKITEASHNVNEESMKQLVASISELGVQLNNLQTKNLEQAKDILKQVPDVSREAAQGIGEIHEEEKKAAEGAIQLNNEVDHLKSRITYFFGLANGVQLFRRALRDAINTTKELDAVMTQTAVVSKNTVGDMWKTLPEYSKEAKKLGAAIKDVYSAQTLYVQQGLEMNQAMDLGVETLKMARVAGIDAAEATNSMTAALRGFNMELTETSALRVNDVYSKLAQNTASNVQEISTAMTKTAALANSANMSFENTAAFLATIIESTREGAETAGTALKTVIARFTEVKKLYSEGELTGTDEEGQEVDVNKISAALRTAGINMNDFFTGARGLDEIFMELGSKWDSLTTVQQRYIATMAAGSRQQSRFLALMQNYSRTVELTTMAYNSAGSGQEQFEKTLDSLEAKINQFKAAWDSFVMGIANSDFIKGAIDAGTKILETINKIIDAISGGNGLVKSISSIAAAVGVFKAGKGLASLLVGGTNGKGGILGPIIGKLFGGKEVGEKAAKGFLGSFSNAIKAGAGKNFLGSLFTTQTISLKNIDVQGLAGQIKGLDLDGNSSLNQSLSKLQADMSKFDINSKEVQQSLENVRQEYVKVHGSADGFDKALQQNSQTFKKTEMSASAFSSSLMITGGALIALGSYLKTTGKEGEKWGKIIQGVGTSLLAFGGVLKLTQVAISTFAKGATASISSIPIIGWIAAAIAALISLGVALQQAGVFGEDSAQTAKRLADESEKLKEKVESLKDEYNNLESKLKEIQEQKDIFSELSKGTVEYDDAVKNLNQSILELIKLYPDLAGAVDYVNGQFVLNDEKYQEYLDKKQKELENAEAISAASNLVSAEAEKNSYGFGKWFLQGFGHVFTGKTNKINLDNNNKVSDWLKAYSGTYGTTTMAEQSLFGIVPLITGGTKNINLQRSVPEEFYGQIDYLAEAISKGELYLDSKDHGSNITQITTLLEKYNKDNGLNNSYRYFDLEKGVTIDYYNIFNEVLKLYQDQLIEFGKNKGIENESNEYLREQAILSTFNNTKVASTKYSDIFYKLSNLIYDSLETTSADIGKKKQQKGFTHGEANKLFGEELSDEAYNKWIESEVKKEKLGNAIDSFYNNFIDKLDNTQKDLFSRLVNQGLEGLTITELDTPEILQENINSLAEILGFTPEEMYKLIGVTNIEEALSNLGNNIYTAIANFSNVEELKSLINSSKFQTVGEATSLTSITAQIQKRGGNGEQFLTQLNSLLDGLDENKLEEAKKIILGTDWSSKESIRSAASSLDELGVSIDRNLTNQIIQATKAVSKFSTTNFEEQLKRLESSRATAEKIEGGERKVTAQEYADMAQEAAVYYGEEEWANDWIRTGIDEWTYIGDETNSLLDSIDGAVKAIAEDTLQEREEAYNAGLNVQEKLTDKVVYHGGSDEIGIDAFKYFESLFEENPQVSNDSLRSAAGLAGININGLTKEEQIDALKNWYDDYGIGGANLEANEQAYLAAKGYATGLYNQTAKEQFLLDQAQTGDEEAAKLLQGKVTAANLDYQVEQMQKSAEVKPEDIEKTKNAYNALALAVKKDVDQIDNLNSVLDDNWQNFKDSEKGTESYIKAITNLIPALKKVFGEQVNEEWIEKYKDQIDALSKGGKEAEQAFEQIRLDQSIEAFNKLEGITGLTGEQLATIQSEWDNLNGSNLDIGGTFDASNILSNLRLTQQQVNDLATYINGLAGMTAEYDVIGKDENGLPIYGLKIHKTGASGSDLSKKTGGGGGGGKSKDFENDFDKYYNMVEDINELQRLRNLLETDYNQLLESEAASGKAIYDNLKRQIQLLRERRDITADLAEKRKQQIIDETQKSENADLVQYAWWNETDLTIEIDWDKINAVKDSELGDRIKDFVSTLEGFQSKYDEQIEALEDIESTLQEIEKRGRDQYTSLEDRVRDALIKRIQDQIDELTAVDEAINDANQKLFDSISQTLELQRQERDNAKTEEELANKEQRLAYLQQDSSGANDVEIARLQQELADARENYTDTLIDQKISELQRQNDEAAQQRQEQISLMQQSLDWQEKSGEFWQQAYEIMSQGVDEQGQLVHQSELETLLKQGEAWTSLSDESKMNWLTELETQVAEAVAYLAMSRQLEDIGTKAGEQITFTNNEGKTLTGTVDKNGNVVVKNKDGSTTTYKDVFQDYNGTYRTFEAEGETKAAQKSAASTNTISTTTNTDIIGKKYKYKYESRSDQYHETYHALEGTNNWISEGLHPHNGSTYCSLCKWKKITTSSGISGGGGHGYDPKRFERYATGGINYQTGPAWLDGTPSKPEAVLNARDTENFIQLRDTLADLRKASGNGEIRGGDNYFEIDINVDKIDSDYDVDRMAERLKTLIYQDGAYRNVNTLSRLR